MNADIMNGFFIDTLQFSKRMQKAGLQKEVSDELAEALRETQVQSVDSLATKKDVESLEKELRKDIENLEVNLEARILLKVGKMMYFNTGLIITAISIAVAIIKL